MPLRNLLLTLHIFGAIVAFGPTFAFPFIGAMGKKEGAPVPWLLKLTETIERKLTLPVALTLQPATGAWLIVQSHNQWNPFVHRNRWLLAALIIYVVAVSFAVFVQDRNAGKAIRMADAGQYGPEFGGLMKKLERGGQFLTVLLVTIIILMVVKPGSGTIHF